jgi:hypothetical protein
MGGIMGTFNILTGEMLMSAFPSRSSEMARNLEQYYPGNEAWSNFVKAIPPEIDRYRLKNELVQSLGGDTEIAKVVFFHVGDGAIRWIAEPVPALDGLRPIDCVADQALIRRLKTTLMRIPS